MEMLSILYLRCFQLFSVGLFLLDVAFNSLFEMQELKTQENQEQVNREPFNSLFEMRRIEDMMKELETEVTFNSLFEMHRRRDAEGHPPRQGRMLSILYLRCAREAVILILDNSGSTFNSLFEMRNGAQAASRFWYCCFQFSI